MTLAIVLYFAIGAALGVPVACEMRGDGKDWGLRNSVAGLARACLLPNAH